MQIKSVDLWQSSKQLSFVEAVVLHFSYHEMYDTCSFVSIHWHGKARKQRYIGCNNLFQCVKDKSTASLDNSCLEFEKLMLH